MLQKTVNIYFAGTTMTESTSNDSYRKMLKLVPSLPHISEAPMSTNFSQMIICIVGGMLCLIPLIFNTESDIEDSQLRESLPERLHRDSAAAVLTLIVPLLLDITTDLLKSCFTTPKEVDKKNLGQPGLLNNMENLLFLIGSSVVPITAFLSTNTKNWAYVYICCRECQYSLSGGAILISLCRYNAKYWPVSTTYLLVILLSSASVIGAFTSNNLIQKPRSQTTKSFQWASYYIFLLAAAIFTFCSLRWLTMSVPKLIKRWNPLLKVSPETSPKSGNTISGNTKESLLFPFLYVMISLVAIFTLFFMSNYYEGPHNFDVRAIFYHNLSFILYLLVITYGSVRMMKHEIVKGLYALIESKKMYVRYISHELRTPLNSACLGIKLVSDDLQSTTETDDRNADHFEILSEVKAACRTAVQILDDLLCFDKLESGILEMHKHEVPVIPFISDCVSMFTSQAKEAGVTMSLVFSQEDMHDDSLTSILEGDTVYMDKFKMDQVLRNLISNALKFTPRGGCVSVTASFVLDEGGTTLSGHPAVRSEGNKSRSFVYSLRRLFCHRRTSRVQSSIGLDIEQGQSANNIHDMVGNISPKGGDNGDFIHGKLVIVVADTGAGISPANQRRLFNEVVQFNPEVLQAGGGSGLGLWITNSLVGMHNGTVRVHSIGEGMGSSFTAEIEMQRRRLHTSSIQEITADTDAPQCELRDGELNQVKKNSGPALQLSTLSTNATCASRNFNSHLKSSGEVEKKVKISNVPYNILVVDDSSLNRKMLCRVLRTSGHLCDEADDGLSAVEKVKVKLVNGERRSYDVILMDFVMPNMDGPTATKVIRDLGYSGSIFGVTGNALDSDINYFLAHGADHVLTKPFDYSLFVHFMGMRALGGHRRELVSS